jgi:hypothetical protein
MTVHKLKTSSGKKSAEGPKTSVAPNAGAKPDRTGWSRQLFDRRLAATLKKTAPGQKKSNLDRVCQTLVEKAAKGDMRALGLVIGPARELEIKPMRRYVLNENMSLVEMSRLYLESIKRTHVDDEELEE